MRPSLSRAEPEQTAITEGGGGMILLPERSGGAAGQWRALTWRRRDNLPEPDPVPLLKLFNLRRGDMAGQ
jgi:hypothetical protein